MEVPAARPVFTAIAEDTPCSRCGYNLRGLSPGGLCPECATPIGRSLRGDLLKYADPDWLEKLRFGASLKLWNIALRILMGVGAGLLVGLAGRAQALAIATTWISAALGLWSTFLITAQEPRISLQEDTVTLRRTIRFCVVGGFLEATLQPLIGCSGVPALIGAISAAGTLAGLVAGFGFLLYLRRFALRIPDAKLAKTTGGLMWTLVIGVGIAIMVVAGTLIASGINPSATPGAGAAGGGGGIGTTVTLTPVPAGAGPLFTFLGCFFALTALVWFLVYVYVLIQYRAAFLEAATEARWTARSSVPADERRPT